MPRFLSGLDPKERRLVVGFCAFAAAALGAALLYRATVTWPLLAEGPPAQADAPQWALIANEDGSEAVFAPLPAECPRLQEGIEPAGMAAAWQSLHPPGIADWGAERLVEGDARLGRVSTASFDGSPVVLATWRSAADGESGSALYLQEAGLLAVAPKAAVERRIELTIGEETLPFQLDHIQLHQADTARLARLGAAAADPCAGIDRIRELMGAITRADGQAKADTPRPPLPPPEGRAIPIDGGRGWTGLVGQEGRIDLLSPNGRVVVRGPERALRDGIDLIADWRAEEQHRIDLSSALTIAPSAKAETGFPAAMLFESPWLVAYPAKGAERARAVVFTDPDCPHCKRLHADLEAIREAGVTLHYAVVPWQSVQRGGEQGMAHRKWLAGMRSAWCAEDVAGRLNQLYAGKPLPEADCLTNGDAEEYMDLMLSAPEAVAKSLGVRSTPTFVSEDGKVFQGYRDVAGLIAQL